MSAIPIRFTDRMKFLAALKFAPKNLDAHWFALQDVTDLELRAAVERAVKECDDFPSPRMLRAFITERRTREREHDDAARLEPDRERHVEEQTFTLPDGNTVPVSREWKYYCDDCHDSGRRSVWCGQGPSPRPWVERKTCDRKYRHGDHEWETFCQCVPRNPDVAGWVKARVASL